MAAWVKCQEMSVGEGIKLPRAHHPVALVKVWAYLQRYNESNEIPWYNETC